MARPLSDEGTVHILEAAMASVLIISALAFVGSATIRPAGDRPDDLGALSSDLLNVLAYRGSSLEHPGLGFALSSRSQWYASRDPLAADIRSMLPAGVYYYMETPYGTLGTSPADGSRAYVKHFFAYGKADGMLDCKLALWRA